MYCLAYTARHRGLVTHKGPFLRVLARSTRQLPCALVEYRGVKDYGVGLTTCWEWWRVDVLDSKSAPTSLTTVAYRQTPS